MTKLEKLAAKIEEFYINVQMDVPKMHRVDNIVDDYFCEVDPHNRLTFKECVLNLGITKANEMYREIKSI